MKHLFFLVFFLSGCSFIADVDESRLNETDPPGPGGQGGMVTTGGQGGQGGSTSSSGGFGGLGGMAGGTAEGGMAGMGGTGGNVGGSGGEGGSPPCETGIYLTVDSQASGGNLGSSAGPVLSTTYVVHGTSVGNELNVSLRLVNNLTGDFTVPQATAAFEAVRIRCQDPDGANSFTVACTETLVSGEATCVMPACYSSSGGTVLMQLQVDPDMSGGGEMARIGIDPTFSLNVCDDQSGNPVWDIQ